MLDAEQVSRSARRRPDLSVNTSRSKSLTTAVARPSTPPFHNPPVPGVRGASLSFTSATQPPKGIKTATTASARTSRSKSTKSAKPTKTSKPAKSTTSRTTRPSTASVTASVPSPLLDSFPSHARSSRHRPSSHAPADSVEAFLEIFTPTDSDMSIIRNTGHSPGDRTPLPNHRDSHDLSLPSRNVRDSLVSNMLLSLDQFSMGQMHDPLSPSGPSLPSRTTNSFDDHRLYSMSTSTTADDQPRSNMPPLSRGVARHGYSYSSDYDVADDASRVSSMHSRGHRSNSSSGFQSSLGRINSMRESLHRGSQPSTPRMMHSRSGKASKSSSSNSIDTSGYVQVLGSQRWAPSLEASQHLPQSSRGLVTSASMGTGMAAASSTLSGPGSQSLHPQPQQQPWHIEFSNSFFEENYDDAAPTPTIPGGPRKLTTMPSMPAIPSYRPPGSSDASFADLKGPGKIPERGRSVRSSRSATVGRQQRSGFSTAAPPVPAFDLDSAPAPHVGYEKSKEAATGGPGPGPQGQQSQPQQQHQLQPQPQPPLQAKERQGFFRRVFGSFRDTVAGSELTSSASSPVANSTVISPTSTDTAAAKSTPPSRESHHSTHATIQKKPSGFFRRRKKSVSESTPIPPLPTTSLVQPTTTTKSHDDQLPPPPPAKEKTKELPRNPPVVLASNLVGIPTPSPGTSLSRAMSPFLKGSPSYANDENTASGSPSTADLPREDYYPEPELSPADKQADADDVARRAVRGFSPDYEPSPKATIRSVNPESDINHNKQKHRPGTPTRAAPQPPDPARSFLSDNSDSEDSPRQTTKNKQGTTKADKHLKQRGSRSSIMTSSVGDSVLLSPTMSHQRSIGSRLNGKTMDVEVESCGSRISLPLEGSGGTSPSLSQRSPDTAIPRMPSMQLNSSSMTGSTPHISDHDPIDEPEFVIGDPTEDDRQKALNIYEGNEDFIPREKAAAWMGEEGPVRQRTLRAYIDLYDFQNMSIVNSLRDVCSRLILRAETQQVDRILVCFSKRWCACNPNHGFKSLDVVHTICYSIMLLNTDLHLADIESKMTRSQFIKNTTTSIRHTLSEDEPEKVKRPSILPGRGSIFSGSYDHDSLAASPAHIPRSNSALGHHNDDAGRLINAPFDGPMHAWENQMEIVLKDIYTSIRDLRLPLFGAEANSGASQTLAVQNSSSQGGLSVMGMLKRSPSVLSKTPSESQNSIRGRMVDQGAGRTGSSRWASKSRSRARVPLSTSNSGANGANGFSSSRTSFEDANSVWSPTVSSATWSRQSLGRTQASMSMESFSSSWGRNDFQQSIGFANALSQAIIREDGLGGIGDDQSLFNGSVIPSKLDNKPLLDDESLELAGPPWVKEGIVTHKHHMGGADKRAKDRNWTEVFAVVQKGQISLFSFTPNKSLRVKSRSRSSTALAKGAVVGGGNWQENATNLGTFGLKQTLASALPPPGYSRQRPHVWALSLPSGAVHLFQVGTPEICKEFVTTVNYWSARLSMHPLVGGISNIEYGWSDSIVNNPLVAAIHQNESSPALVHTNSMPPSSSGPGAIPSSGSTNNLPASRPGSAAAGRASLHSRGSFRSGSFDFGHTRSGSASSGFASNAGAALHSSMASVAASRHGSKLPGDRIHIAEWVSPAQSSREPSADEARQLQVLLAYVKSIEDELQAHNALRSPMLLAFTPRGHNSQKAMANWERKSSYLLREIVKYRTYVDCLTSAERRRAEIYHERDIARRAALGEEHDPTDDEVEGEHGEGGNRDGGRESGCEIDDGRHIDDDNDSRVEEGIDNPDATLRP